MSGYLIDTNVFSEVFKANAAVVEFLKGLDGELLIDTTVFIECIQGSKSNSEKATIKRFLSTFPLLPYNSDISRIAIDLVDRYSNSHGLLLADALIAASALSGAFTLVTYNIADFEFIDELNCLRPVR